ncbi:MAG TPA: hypothetical protein ENH11_05635, partial [Candidatus Acetothermia bacterium]|nr:hypothetical protein [Candidatus Acetothermia bacterium]
MIITLMGIDGCGKSSLAGLLQTELTKRGHKSVVAWATLEPVILRPFIWAAKRIMVRRHDKFADYRAHDSAKKSG